MRLLALLLTVIMLTGTAAQASASPGATISAALDDVPDVDAALPALPEPVAIASPPHALLLQIAAPAAPSLGRPHAVLIFRPPR